MLLSIAKNINYLTALLYIVLATFNLGGPDEFKYMARVGYCGVIYFLLKEMEEEQCGTVGQDQKQQKLPSPSKDETHRDDSVD